MQINISEVILFWIQAVHNSDEHKPAPVKLNHSDRCWTRRSAVPEDHRSVPTNGGTWTEVQRSDVDRTPSVLREWTGCIHHATGAYLPISTARESWTMTQRINAFEQLRYQRLLKIKWSDKVTNKEVIHWMKDKEIHLPNSITKLKTEESFARHVFRWSSGRDTLQILAWRKTRKQICTMSRWMWLDDIKN